MHAYTQSKDHEPDITMVRSIWHTFYVVSSLIIVILNYGISYLLVFLYVSVGLSSTCRTNIFYHIAVTLAYFKCNALMLGAQNCRNVCYENIVLAIPRRGICVKCSSVCSNFNVVYFTSETLSLPT